MAARITARALWQTVTRVETDKFIPWIGLRNALGVGIVITIGILLGNVSAGLVMGTGALNVSFSDGKDAYLQRARRMLLAAFFCGLAVVIGSTTGHDNDVAVPIATCWALLAGMLVALGNTPGDIGTVSLVTLVVFAAQSMPPQKAALSGLLAFAGGVLQTLLSTVTWPFLRYRPKRRALSQLYSSLKRMIEEHIDADASPPATSQSSDAQKILAELRRDYSLEGERYRSLLTQAERARLSILTIKRLRARMRREGLSALPEILTRALDLSARICGELAEMLQRSVPTIEETASLQELQQLGNGLRTEAAGAAASALARDARFQVAALAGQLRAAASLTSRTVGPGGQAFEREESRKPWMLRLSGPLAILRANLTLESTACRHAIRLAACIAIGDAFGRSMSGPRPYWIPMTIAIVLKPDFNTTISRGLLRLAGTFAGLVLTTGFYHLMLPPLPAQVFIITWLTFTLRCFGPANYGILTAAVSSLIVLLVALTGVSPKEVIAARALNTTIGGVLALIAYIVWPTWERTQLPDTMAKLLDAYRQYLHALTKAYLEPGQSLEALDRCRLNGRLARSTAEASVERYRNEPGARPDVVDQVMAMFASSHRLVHASMALEAELLAKRAIPLLPAFPRFADDVYRTLELLVDILRGARVSESDFPDLREDHTRLLEESGSRFTLLCTETDRITNALNTLREQVVNWKLLEQAADNLSLNPVAGH